MFVCLIECVVLNRNTNVSSSFLLALFNVRRTGVSGLLKRLANDLVMPKFLAQTNSRGAAHMAIITFVIVSMSLFLAIFNPDEPKAIGDFGGVFAISFLSVLVAFAAAAVLLKLYRARLARMVIAKWWHIILSLCAVSAGLLGNIILTPTVFELFVIYLSGFLAVVIYMSTKVEVFSFGIWMVSYFTTAVLHKRHTFCPPSASSYFYLPCLPSLPPAITAAQDESERRKAPASQGDRPRHPGGVRAPGPIRRTQGAAVRATVRGHLYH
jgi:amino acid transporter